MFSLLALYSLYCILKICVASEFVHCGIDHKLLDMGELIKGLLNHFATYGIAMGLWLCIGRCLHVVWRC